MDQITDIELANFTALLEQIKRQRHPAYRVEHYGYSAAARLAIEELNLHLHAHRDDATEFGKTFVLTDDDYIMAMAVLGLWVSWLLFHVTAAVYFEDVDIATKQDHWNVIKQCVWILKKHVVPIRAIEGYIDWKDRPKKWEDNVKS